MSALSAGLVTTTGLSVIRLYSGDDGTSHLEDAAYSMATTRHGLIAENVAVAEIALYTSGADGGGAGFAVSPGRQLVITLAGRAEVEASDGARRMLEVGTIMLAEDTSGAGHRIHVVEEPRLVLVAPLSDKKRAPSGLLW